MTTATITYHWMPNYGAVLQTYALQQFLYQNKIENEVIDYVPFRIKWRTYIGYCIRREKDKLSRISQTKKFVKMEIKTTNKRYRKHRDLCNLDDKYEAYICGSDQIWCEWFIKNAEKGHALSYYLDFIKEKKKIAYAVSFGTTQFTDKKIEKEIVEQIKTFHCVGVREVEGQQFIKNKGIHAELVCDPVFLVNPSKYEALANKSAAKGQQILKFVLHNKTKLADEIIGYYDSKYKQKKQGTASSVYDWLKFIKDSELIVTDSFHCMAFAVIFHKNFIVIPTSSKGFDSRIVTLLTKIGLESRMCDTAKMMGEEIEWDDVQEKLSKFSYESEQFLTKCLKRE